MPVQEILGNLGSWTIKFDPSIPRDVLDAISFLGHVAVIPGRIDPAQYGDNLLAPGSARYVGVVRTRTWGDDGRTSVIEDDLEVGGSGMAFWLGDEDDKGPVIENTTTFASASFATAVRGLLPASGAVTEGTLYSVPGLYSGTHRWQTSRTAIQYVCTTVGTPSAPANWRVNNNATLDAGPESALFVTNPVCVILPTGAGEDMAMRALVGSTDTTRDVQDYTTRVVLLAQGTGDSIATAAADLAPGSNPYKDLHGNPAAITRMVSESATDTGNASTRAQLALSQYTAPKTNLTLSTTDYDIHGTFTVGDYVYVYDPDAGLFDPAVEVTFRGRRINPIKLQITEADWAVTSGYTVAYRDASGVWTDLTRYVAWETDTTVSVTVGGLQRALTDQGGEQVGSRPSADTSIPGVPTFVTPFVGAAYLDSRGFTRSRVRLQWNAPLNTDGSTILDGDHYEIRWAVDTDMVYPATWAAVSQIRWEDMQIWRQPFAAPTGQWQTMAVAWDQATAQLQDLSPGIGYDVQIRAVDSSGNTGAWSATTTFVATSDNIPPSTPAAPSVAASRIAVQVTHTLGTSAGGTFNLESDLDHLEIHAAYEPTFTPSPATLLGKLKANAGMIQAQIAAVGTYNVESTNAVYVRVVAVDIAGNRSGPSDAASATALLIDDAHISDLTVSKVTAGTITAAWVLAGEIKTADSGPRFRASAAGIELYNAAGTRTLFGDASTGNITMTGELNSGISGNRVVVNPSGAGLPTIRFYANTGTDFAFINGTSSGTDVQLGLNSSPFTSGTDTLTTRLYLTTGQANLETIDSATQTRKGGWVSSFSNQVALGYTYNGTDGANGFMGATSMDFGIRQGLATERSLYIDTDGLNIIGLMRGQIGSADAVIAGVSADSAAGVATITVSYVATMGSTPFPLITAASNSTVGAYRLSASTSTGFTVTRDTTTSSFRVGYWSFRS